MAKDLTVKAIEALKPGNSRLEVPDGHTRGLFYVLQPTGAASWAFRYRFAGKPKKLTLGPYPALDLKAARQMASEAAQMLARKDAVDPAAAKQVAKVAARTAAEEVKRAAEPARDLVETVVETFVERYAKKQTREKTSAETERLLKREVVEPWRGRHLSEIKRADVHDLLDKIVDRDAPILANRTLAALRRMCSWAVERGIIEQSPCEKVRAPAPETSRDRVLSDEEIRLVWSAFDGAGWPFGPLAKLLLLTGQRLREIGEMAWGEIDFDAKTWTIPKERAKNAAAHEVPLSGLALETLAGLHRIAAGGDDEKAEPRPKAKPRRPPTGFVFTTNGKTAVSGFSRSKEGFDRAIAFALRKSATERGDDPEKVEALAHWTLHDLRRTAASGMAGIGIPPHIVEAALNHKSGTIKGVAAVYNRYSYSGEKRQALDAWARRLDEIVNGRKAANVVELAKARA